MLHTTSYMRTYLFDRITRCVKKMVTLKKKQKKIQDKIERKIEKEEEQQEEVERGKKSQEKQLLKEEFQK